MKSVLFLIILLVLPLSPIAFALLGDKTGFVQRLSIETGGYNFEVATVSSFDITDYEFNSDEKRLTMFISSTVQNNLAEIQIPKNLINGNFTFYLNDEQIEADVIGNERISFITLEFPGDGFHKLDIIGTTYLPEFSTIASLVLATSLIGILFLKKVNKRIIH